MRTQRKRQEREKRGEREINFRQHRYININSEVYIFTVFILVSELNSQSLYPPHVTRHLRHLSSEAMTTNIWLH